MRCFLFHATPTKSGVYVTHSTSQFRPAPDWSVPTCDGQHGSRALVASPRAKRQQGHPAPGPANRAGWGQSESVMQRPSSAFKTFGAQRTADSLSAVHSPGSRVRVLFLCICPVIGRFSPSQPASSRPSPAFKIQTDISPKKMHRLQTNT